MRHAGRPAHFYQAAWRRRAVEPPRHFRQSSPFMLQMPGANVDRDPGALDALGDCGSATLICGCGVDFLRRLDPRGRRVLVYCDPPYPRSTRKDPNRDYYQHEWTDLEMPTWTRVSNGDQDLLPRPGPQRRRPAERRRLARFAGICLNHWRQAVVYGRANAGNLSSPGPAIDSPRASFARWAPSLPARGPVSVVFDLLCPRSRPRRVTPCSQHASRPAVRS